MINYKYRTLFLSMMMFLTLSSAVFYLWHNANFFPTKERHTVTLKLYYDSGFTMTKVYNLPKDAVIKIVKRSYTTGLWYDSSSGPFSNEFGYLAFDVIDFEVVSK